jgi:hypothetical protein
MCECWPKAQNEKRQHQSEENAICAPEATDPGNEWTIHINGASLTPGRVPSSQLSGRQQEHLFGIDCCGSALKITRDR